MSLPQMTLSGTLTNDAEIKFVGNGTAVCNFSVAVNDRRYNRDTGQWEDGDVTYVDVVAWKALAENAADTLRKGSRIVAVGRLKQEFWEKDGQKRSRYKFDTEDLGVSLKFSQKPKSDPWA